MSFLVRAKLPGAPVYAGGRKFSHGGKGQRLDDKALAALVGLTDGAVKTGRLLFLTGRLELVDAKTDKALSVTEFQALFPDEAPSRIEAALTSDEEAPAG